MNNTPNEKRKNTGWIWMLVCCLAPILLIALLGATGRSAGSILYIVALLICPLGMIAMMFMRSGSHCAPNNHHESRRRGD